MNRNLPNTVSWTCVIKGTSSRAAEQASEEPKVPELIHSGLRGQHTPVLGVVAGHGARSGCLSEQHWEGAWQAPAHPGTLLPGAVAWVQEQ